MVASMGCENAVTPDWQSAVAPVSGSVEINGQPAADVFINLHPIDNSGAETQIVPRAQTDSQGNFVVSTYLSGDGAPVGSYGVSFSWVGPLNGLKEDEYEKLPEKIAAKYRNAVTSGIKITVTEGPNELAPFQLN
jgi:hypothetical protein